jgi:hypothetical protein
MKHHCDNKPDDLSGRIAALAAEKRTLLGGIGRPAAASMYK